MASLIHARIRMAPAIRAARPPKVTAAKRAVGSSRESPCLGWTAHRPHGISRRSDRTIPRFSFIDEDMYEDIYEDDEEGDEEPIVLDDDLDEDEEDLDEMMEDVLDKEDDLGVDLQGDSEEEEMSVDAEETEDAAADMPSGCPEGFSLNFLWLDKYIAIAVDQIFSKTRRSPLTEYFVWPRTDAWEELRERLSQNPWIEETDQILLLNRATEVINYWQEEGQTHTLDDAKAQFPDCSFAGS